MALHKGAAVGTDFHGDCALRPDLERSVLLLPAAPEAEGHAAICAEASSQKDEGERARACRSCIAAAVHVHAGPQLIKQGKGKSEYEKAKEAAGKKVVKKEKKGTVRP